MNCFKFLLIVLVLLPISSISAQNTEISINATFVRSNPNFKQPSLRFNSESDQIGFDASITTYVGKSPFGLKMDIASSWQKGNSRNNNLTTVMAGPTLKFRGHKVEPFVHGLLGVGRFFALNKQNVLEFDRTTSGLAYTVGGGLDVKVAKHVAIRAFQGDLITTTIEHKNVRYWRAGAGLVFNF